MATFGHEGGNWMNDDQRGEMRERARVAELEAIELPEELTQKLAEETSNDGDWRRLVDAARRGAAAQAEKDWQDNCLNYVKKELYDVALDKANKLQAMIANRLEATELCLEVQVDDPTMLAAALVTLSRVNPTVKHWFMRYRKEGLTKEQMLAGLVLSLVKQNQGLMDAEAKRMEQSACLFCGQPAGVAPGR